MDSYDILFWEYDIPGQYTIEEKNLTIDEVRNHILEDPYERLWRWQISCIDDTEEKELFEDLKKIISYNSVDEIIDEFNDWCKIGGFDYIWRRG